MRAGTEVPACVEIRKKSCRDGLLTKYHSCSNREGHEFTGADRSPKMNCALAPGQVLAATVKSVSILKPRRGNMVLAVFCNGPSKMRSFAQRVALHLLRAYKWAISPMFPPSCRYTPTCSEYAIEAIERLGALRGGLKAVWRILRCHPFVSGGYDPVIRESTTCDQRLTTPHHGAL